MKLPTLLYGTDTEVSGDIRAGDEIVTGERAAQ